jgi:hypothetical protein
MDKIYAAVNELNQAEVALSDFKQSHYMPWQLDEPVGYAERKADENFRAYAGKVSDRVKKARENLIAECQRYCFANPI